MEKRKGKIRKKMILIAIGSNLISKIYGDPYQNCLQALEFIKKKFKIEKISKFYKTEPVPKSNQPWYVNGVISIETKYSPNDILNILMNIEKKFLRVRNVRNEPRVIDLDLLTYKRVILNEPDLIIPHPRMHLRKFVIQPICDIDESWVHPVLNLSAQKLLKSLALQQIFNINENYHG